MFNLAMKKKLEGGEAIDLKDCKKTADGDYILTNVADDMDYCDSSREVWIRSIGKNKKTGQIFASTTAYFFNNPCYECLWLR